MQENLCLHPLNAPANQLQPPIAAADQAWRILAAAEEAFEAKSLAQARAAKSGGAPPTSISDYLFWIKAEIPPQEACASRHALAAREWERRARALSGVAGELHKLGFTTPPTPWQAANQTFPLDVTEGIPLPEDTLEAIRTALGALNWQHENVPPELFQQADGFEARQALRNVLEERTLPEPDFLTRHRSESEDGWLEQAYEDRVSGSFYDE